MIQIGAPFRILVAVAAIDGRKGVDAIAQLCREKLNADPFSGHLFIFRTGRGTAIKILQYDGQGVLAGDQTFVQGPFPNALSTLAPMVAHGNGSGANAARASGAVTAGRRQPPPRKPRRRGAR